MQAVSRIFFTFDQATTGLHDVRLIERPHRRFRLCTYILYKIATEQMQAVSRIFFTFDATAPVCMTCG